MSRVRSSVARLVPIFLAVFAVLGAGPAAAGKSVGSVNFTLGDKSMTGDWVLDFRAAPRAEATGDTLNPGRPIQPALGFELTWGHQGWPAWVALDVLHSYDDGVQYFPAIHLGALVIPPAHVRRRARTIEVGLGVRRSWTVLGWTPYLGGGGSWVRGSVAYEMSDPSQGSYGAPGPRVSGRDAAFGYWAGGGVYRRIGPRFQLGLTARYSKAKIDLPSVRVVGESGHYRFVPIALRELDAGGKHLGVVVGWSFPSR